MNDPNIIQFKPTSPSLRNPIWPQPRWRRNALLIIVFALSNFALLAEVKAVDIVDISDTYYGTGAFNATSTGGLDSAFGYNALHSDTSGSYNTANGSYSLYQNTIGGNNTATGFFALQGNTTGTNNTADGVEALYDNNTGVQNTATGAFALHDSYGTTNNTADGFQALYGNNTGVQNTATGAFALDNSNGTNNTADGFQALLENTTGAQNTATGGSALLSNTTANNNTADGFQALNTNTGASNTALGSKALFRNTTGSSNIGLGVSAGANLTTGSNNIAIGNFGVAGESNTIRIGGVQTRTFIKGISGVAIAGAPVVVNAAGQLGVAPSSAHFKNHIRPMDAESETILALTPVSFCYDQDIDDQSLPQFGLVAEEVEKVNPDLVVRDADGKPYTVRYEAVNAMLLNEFLKAHRKIQALEAGLAQQQDNFQATITRQQEQIDALTAGLQKVSAQLELTKPAPQTVKNTD